MGAMDVDPEALRIVVYPDPALRRPAEPIEEIDDMVRAVAVRMIVLMHEAEGVGLAAPQVGLSWRMFVTVVPPEEREDDQGLTGRVFINPEIHIESRDLEVLDEGCLSLPGIRADIRRPGAVRISATGLDGGPVELADHELMARVWQHEIDHLNGVLIIDRLSPMDRIATRKAIRELELEATEG